MIPTQTQPLNERLRSLKVDPADDGFSARLAERLGQEAALFRAEGIGACNATETDSPQVVPIRSRLPGRLTWLLAAALVFATGGALALVGPAWVKDLLPGTTELEEKSGTPAAAVVPAIRGRAPEKLRPSAAELIAPAAAETKLQQKETASPPAALNLQKLEARRTRGNDTMGSPRKSSSLGNALKPSLGRLKRPPAELKKLDRESPRSRVPRASTPKPSGQLRIPRLQTPQRPKTTGKMHLDNRPAPLRSHELPRMREERRRAVREAYPRQHDQRLERPEERPYQGSNRRSGSPRQRRR